jgi:glycosyltransferase involved in cell wall biosynthesis
MKTCIVSTYLTSEGGVSSYTKRLVWSLREHGVDAIVFSDKPRNETPKLSGESVYATWSKGILYPFQIFKMLAANSHVDVVHIQHEFFLYGGMFSAIFFPVLLALIHLLGKPVVVTVHGVIPLSELNERFKEENQLNGPLPLLKFGLVLLTKLIVFLSNAVIVHGRLFAEALYNEYKCPRWKVYVIPHGVEKAKTIIPQGEAKKRFRLENKVIILFFGYIAKYKGIETLIEAFGRVAKKHQDWILVIGGGRHPRLCLGPKYQEYIMELQQMARSLAPKQIVFTGFIPDEELPLYFSAADIVVLPYARAMSSSGPLALAMSYRKPVIVSNILPITELIPFEKALFMRNSPESLAERLELILDNQHLQREISRAVEKIRTENSWSSIGLQTSVLYQDLLLHHKERE